MASGVRIAGMSSLGQPEHAGRGQACRRFCRFSVARLESDNRPEADSAGMRCHSDVDPIAVDHRPVRRRAQVTGNGAEQGPSGAEDEGALTPLAAIEKEIVDTAGPPLRRNGVRCARRGREYRPDQCPAQRASHQPESTVSDGPWPATRRSLVDFHQDDVGSSYEQRVIPKHCR